MMPLRYLSVCSGIEAATVAWHPLGWTPVAFSEVDPFPCAVLAHHYPTVPNWGDMTKFQEWPHAIVDVLVGGTPCQSFSVAGLRAGLADPRGSLLLTYLAVAERYRPRWLVWENVTGVLSADGGRAFGSLLGGLAELGYGVAYRVLDAQYFRLAQRRKRVFVVGYLGDWRRATAVLFERASLSGHPAPRREAGQDVTTSTAPSLTGSGRGVSRVGESRGQDPVIPVGHCIHGVHWASECRECGIWRYYPERARPLTTSNQRIDWETETLITHSLKADGFDASEDGTGRGTPLVPCAFDARQSDVLQYGNLSGPLDTDGTSIAVAFQSSQSGVRVGETHATLDSHNGSRRHHGIVQHMAVRRLTPREGERLQGFPDDYTLIPYRGKPAADGPRYKALGNSMAVPVMAWIGQRIQLVDAIAKSYDA